MGWYGSTEIPCLNQAPSTASATGIAAAQAPTTGVALTLTTATTGGIAVLGAATKVYPSQNIIPSTALVLDGAPGLLSWGQNGAVQTYDPTKAIARAVVVTYAGNDTSTGYATVTGYDLYGYPQTEKISGASGTTTNGKKAWKFITAVTPGGTLSGSNISAGTLDIFGLPLRVDSFFELYPTWNSASGTSSGFVKADTTSPATSVTGDVRGTYNPGTSDGTKKLQVYITPDVNNLFTNAQTALVGVVPA
jgi:hypothetical protein